MEYQEELIRFFEGRLQYWRRQQDAIAQDSTRDHLEQIPYAIQVCGTELIVEELKADKSSRACEYLDGLMNHTPMNEADRMHKEEGLRLWNLVNRKED